MWSVDAEIGKHTHTTWLVENDKNIVTTHSLIKMMDLDMLELLKSKNYVLMIDECLDVLDTYKISKDDLKIIFNEKLVSLDEDGFLVWNEERKPYKGVYGDIKRLCSFKSLMGFKKENSDELARIIMWNFPVDFFKCFDESYIFTYLWEGSIQKSYFDIHGIKYEKYMLSALLQWIWRSQIRDGKSINLYIPSERMRELLKMWINECKTMSEAA